MVSSNKNNNPYFVPKFFMKFGGLWPTERPTYDSVAIFCFNLAVQITLLRRLAGEIREFNTHKDIHWEVGDILVRIATYVIIRACGGQMMPLITATTDDCLSITDPEEQEIMRSHNEKGTYYFGFAFAWTVVQLRDLVAFVYRRTRELGYFSFTILPQESQTELIDSFFSSVGMPLLNVVGTILSHITAYGVDLLFWSLTMQLSAQFKIHTLRCQRFLQIRSESESRKELRRLVERHNQILDLLGTLEDAFTLYIALRVFWLQLQICALAYNWAAYRRTLYMEELNIFANLMVSLSSMYVFYYAGDYLTGCSEDIGEVFRQCKWYTLSKESRINFSIIAGRTQTAKTLTLAKLYKLKRSNFLHVLHAVYSYITLIVAISDVVYS